jgi:cell division protein FtsB
VETGALSRDELIAIITAQQAQLEVLVARVAALEEENRRLRQGKGGGTPLAVKPSRPPKEKQPRKRRDRSFVRRKETPDEVRYHAVESCPDCGRRLCGGFSRQAQVAGYRARYLPILCDHLMTPERLAAHQGNCDVCRG